MFMKIRTAFGLVALVAGLIGGSVANAATCTNEFTGAALNATVVGTYASEKFGPNEPYPRTLYDYAVVSAGGGNDIVEVQGLAGLTICLNAGDDQVINGVQARPSYLGLGFSVRGGADNDRVEGTPFKDAVNGRKGNDVFVDPVQGDGDICRNFELTINCEGGLPPDASEGPE